MLPLEKIVPNDYRSQITIDSRIDQPLYIFKLSEVYSSLNLSYCVWVKLRDIEKVVLLISSTFRDIYIYICIYICIYVCIYLTSYTCMYLLFFFTYKPSNFLQFSTQNFGRFFTKNAVWLVAEGF